MTFIDLIHQHPVAAVVALAIVVAGIVAVVTAFTQ